MTAIYEYINNYELKPAALIQMKTYTTSGTDFTHSFSEERWKFGCYSTKLFILKLYMVKKIVCT